MSKKTVNTSHGKRILRDEVYIYLEKNRSNRSEKKGRPKRPETCVSDEGAIHTLILKHPVSDLCLEEITADDLSEWREWALNLRHKGKYYNSTYQNRARACLISILQSYFINMGRTYDAAYLIKPFPNHPRKLTEDDILNEDEIEAVKDAARSRDQSMADMLIFELTEGTRPGETCAMKVKWFDPVNRLYHVNNTMVGSRRNVISEDGRVKTDEARRTLVLTREANEILMRRSAGKDPEDPIFQSVNGTPIELGNYRRFVKRLVLKVTGKTVTPHHLRSSWATYAIDHANSPRQTEIIARHLGHTDSTTTMKWYRARHEMDLNESRQLMDMFE